MPHYVSGSFAALGKQFIPHLIEKNDSIQIIKKQILKDIGDRSPFHIGRSSQETTSIERYNKKWESLLNTPKKLEKMDYVQGSITGAIFSDLLLKQHLNTKWFQDQVNNPDLDPYQSHSIQFTYIDETDNPCGIAISYTDNEWCIAIIKNTVSPPEDRIVFLCSSSNEILLDNDNLNFTRDFENFNLILQNEIGSTEISLLINNIITDKNELSSIVINKFQNLKSKDDNENLIEQDINNIVKPKLNSSDISLGILQILKRERYTIEQAIFKLTNDSNGDLIHYPYWKAIKNSREGTNKIVYFTPMRNQNEIYNINNLMPLPILLEVYPVIKKLQEDGFTCILPITQISRMHWCVLIINNDNIIYFDPKRNWNPIVDNYESNIAAFVGKFGGNFKSVKENYQPQSFFDFDSCGYYIMGRVYQHILKIGSKLNNEHSTRISFHNDIVETSNISLTDIDKLKHDLSLIIYAGGKSLNGVIQMEYDQRISILEEKKLRDQFFYYKINNDDYAVYEIINEERLIKKIKESQNKFLETPQFEFLEDNETLKICNYNEPDISLGNIDTKITNDDVAMHHSKKVELDFEDSSYEMIFCSQNRNNIISQESIDIQDKINESINLRDTFQKEINYLTTDNNQVVNEITIDDSSYLNKIQYITTYIYPLINQLVIKKTELVNRGYHKESIYLNSVIDSLYMNIGLVNIKDISIHDYASNSKKIISEAKKSDLSQFRGIGKILMKILDVLRFIFPISLLNRICCNFSIFTKSTDTITKLNQLEREINLLEDNTASTIICNNISSF